MCLDGSETTLELYVQNAILRARIELLNSIKQSYK